MDVPLPLIHIGIHQGLQGFRKSSTFCQKSADVVGLSALYVASTIYENKIHGL